MLISGTRKGLGMQLVAHYAMQNIHLIGCSRSEVDYKYSNYEHFCLDITEEKDVKGMLSEIRKKYGQLDVLVNNAGINLALAPMLLVPYQSALKTIETNLLGTFLMSRETIKLMMKNSSGRIINIGSMAVRHEVKGEAIYTASKAGVHALTRVLAKEVFGFGITCNVIAPSAIKTDLLESIDEEVLNDVLDRNAIPQLGKIEDLINTIDWLIKPESSSITGQIIFLGGA